MRSLALLPILLALMFISEVTFAGGNITAGGSPAGVDSAAIRQMIANGGLKRAMLNYLNTIQISQIEDEYVRGLFDQMIHRYNLALDVQNSNYVIAGVKR